MMMSSASTVPMRQPARRCDGGRGAQRQVEIEAYDCIVIDDEVNERGYLADSDEWFLPWLFRLRLGSVTRRSSTSGSDYRSPTVEDRRLKFVSYSNTPCPTADEHHWCCIACFRVSVRLGGSGFRQSRRARADSCRASQRCYRRLPTAMSAGSRVG